MDNDLRFENISKVCFVMGELRSQLSIKDWDWEDVYKLAVQIMYDWEEDVDTRDVEERGYCLVYARRFLLEMYSDERDAVSPDHSAQDEVKCIDAIESAVRDLCGIEAFCTGNAIKYLWRWKQENGIEDLEKAQWYINRLARTGGL